MSRAARLGSSLFLLVACDRHPRGAAATPEDAQPPTGAIEVPTLPETLVGTFVPAGADAQGRVLIVSEDMLATIGCAECGVPSYVRLQQIACLSEQSCLVAGEGCRGQLRREGERLIVTMQGDGEQAAGCAGYGGEFVPGEASGIAGEVIASSEAPRGHVLIGDIHSPREVDIDASRRVADARIPELDACYQAALIDSPQLSGRVVIEVVHGARGASKAPANLRQISFEHPSVGDCLRAALQDRDYPLAADGLPAPVYYSLELVLR